LGHINSEDRLTTPLIREECDQQLKRHLATLATWLGLCPDNRISGDRVLRRGTRRVINRAATALRMAATTLMRSRSYLGASTADYVPS
jgi:transposase